VQEPFPVASLVIPNNLYWLWKKKINCLKSLNLNIPSYTQLLNDRIGGRIIANNNSEGSVKVDCTKKVQGGFGYKTI